MHINYLVVASVFVVAMSQFAGGQPSNPQQSAMAPADQEIRQLLRGWDEACRHRDVQGLARVLADEFTLTDASGAVLTLPQYLMSIVKSPDFAKVTSCASEDVTIQVDGDTAVVTGRSPVKGRPRGKAQAFAGNYQFTDRWVKRQGSWRAVATQATRTGTP